MKKYPITKPITETKEVVTSIESNSIKSKPVKAPVVVNTNTSTEPRGGNGGSEVLFILMIWAVIVGLILLIKA